MRKNNRSQSKRGGGFFDFFWGKKPTPAASPMGQSGPSTVPVQGPPNAAAVDAQPGAVQQQPGAVQEQPGAQQQPGAEMQPGQQPGMAAQPGYGGGKRKSRRNKRRNKRRSTKKH